MQVPFRLRKTSRAAPAAGLLLLSEDVADLLALCARLGPGGAGAGGTSGGPGALPPVYPVPGGFVVQPRGAVPAALPGVVRLHTLAPNLYLPVDSELVPGLLADEAAGLVRGRGLVFLPGGQVLGFDPARPLPLAALLWVGRVSPRGWQPLPPPVPRPERLREILLEKQDETPDVILERGGTSVGVEQPRPPAGGLLPGAAGHASSALGRALVWLGGLLRWPGLARAGAGMVRDALGRVPRLSEGLLGRQEAALRELLRQFREGNLEEALRRALPLGGGPGRGKSTPYRDARLPAHNLAYRLADLLGLGRGPASIWYGGGDVQAELANEYRRAAEEATRRGDHRRAAFIYGR